MNEARRRECEKLRAFSSEEAADRLLTDYGIDDSNYGEAFVLLPHRSWKRSDQIRLARHYFKKIPFASSKPYAVFASFTSVPLLVELLEEFAPVVNDELTLFRYHIEPVLKSSASKEEIFLVEDLLRKLEVRAQQSVQPDRREDMAPG